MNSIHYDDEINNAYDQYLQTLNSYDQYLQTLPIEMFPGYRPHTEPIPLHGPDYSQWTLKELLYEGLLELNYEGTSFLDIIQHWDKNGPLDIYLEPDNIHILQLIISWSRVAEKTPAQYQLFPKFPFKLKIDRHCNFSCE